MNKLQTFKNVAWNILLITLGCFIFALGAEGILVHHGFIIGGLYGTALLIFYNTDLLSTGIWYLLINIPLLLAGWFFLSRRFFLYSLYGVFMLSFFTEILELNFAIHDQLYAAITGGAICGVGTGVILRSRGSCGGLDSIAILLNEKFNFGIGKFYMLFNVCLFTFVLNMYEPDLVIASVILTFISATTLEQVLALFNQRKIVYILSQQQNNIIETITKDLHQGATLLEARGAYSGNKKQMLMTITNNLQLKKLEEKVFKIDPDALFIVENSFNVIGSSFNKRKIY